MILVAGGAGYIGSHMLKALRKQGRKHAAMDDLSRGSQQAVKQSPLYVASLKDREAMKKVFSEHEINCVLHFAASIEVGESVKDPSGFWENNFIGAWNLLEVMREFGVSQFVFSSTAAVYGEPVQIPIPEDHPKNPASPYGDTKLGVERMLSAYDRAYGLKSVVLRYFNACGADSEGELGENHHPETHLIPRAILAALGRAPELTLFGTDYPTPDGTCIRDYIHVEDLADAHLRAIDHLAGGGASHTFNLGSGEGFSVRQVIDAVERVSGRAVPVKEAPRREGDPARLVADSAKIRSEWGWSPQWTSLDDIVAHALAWFVNHPDGYPSESISC
jgi:UDP-glucose 4-epimerase